LIFSFQFQELYALGLVGSLSSFFTTYPVTTVLGRSMLNVECGAKTQVDLNLFPSLYFNLFN
jgi:hypothetical protein